MNSPFSAWVQLNSGVTIRASASPLLEASLDQRMHPLAHGYELITERFDVSARHDTAVPRNGGVKVERQHAVDDT